MSIIRVVSYNIHKGRSGLISRARLNELRLGLHGVGADLVFLQEVQGRNDITGMLHAQHESLAAALRLDVAYGCNAIRERTDHGNALLSRFPILCYENLDISDHRMEQRGLLHAQVRIRGTDVHCFVVHLGLFAGSRTRQADALIERIESAVPPECPIIIAGDFNDWNDKLSAVLVQRLNLHEVFATAQSIRGAGLPRFGESLRLLRRSLRAARGGQLRTRAAPPRLSSGGLAPQARPPRTYPSGLPWFRLDRIYQRGFAVRSARVLRGPPWTTLSDHVPLLTDIELP